MAMESRFTWMNGELVPTEKALLPFLTSGLHYGVGVFEGLRCYETAQGPAIFRLRDHAVRMVESCRIIMLELPYDADTISQACVDVVASNEFRECYLRPHAFTTTAGWNLSTKNSPVALGVAAWKWASYLGENALAQGARANVSTFTRHHGNVTMTKAKVAGNYVNSTLAKTESMRLGFDEAIMLDPQGNIAECTGANIFVVRGGKLYTPPRHTILEGITRDSIITLARDLGIPVVEEIISRDQLYIADEVFVTGTAAEVVGFREIDGRSIGAGVCGPVTRALQKAYHAVVRGEDPRYAHWLTQVPTAAVKAA